MEDFMTLLGLLKTVGETSTKNDADLLKLIATLAEAVTKLTTIVDHMGNDIEELSKELARLQPIN